MTTAQGREVPAAPAAGPGGPGPGAVEALAAPAAAWLRLAAFASVGAGVVHAAAAGAHAGDGRLVALFTALAAVQVLWAGPAVARPTRATALAGTALGVLAALGWALAVTAGLPVLGPAEGPAVADSAAAVLALATALLAGAAVAAPAAGPVVRPGLAALLVCAVAAGGTATAGAHVGHAHPERDDLVASADRDGTGAGGAHDAQGRPGGEDDGHARGVPEEGHGPVADPVPYDPAVRPVDLGGVPGVTPAQQRSAEQLVERTLDRLPQWADAARAEAAGFRSIGDGASGTEHLVNVAFLVDGSRLDPDRPESLVYDTTGGGRRLVAAMYVLEPGTSLDEVPDVGGPLVQWHVHEDLCFTPDGRLAGLTDASGRCGPGRVRPPVMPMLHVWITPHPCGPFAALEGTAGGQVRPGEDRLCDTAHGSPS